MSYQIRLVPSGHSFAVESGQQIMSAGHAAGIKIPFGCRMGTCRSCRGKVISGKVDLGDAHPAYLPEDQRRHGYALLCRATAKSDLTIEIDELPPLVEPQVAPGLVKKVERITDDVALLQLRLPLHMNMMFEAGQYIDFLLEGGARRSYSIANPPKLDGVINLEFHIRHMPGGLFTDRVFGGMKDRDKLTFEGPLGGFFLRESDKPALFLATGTGYAPIRSILLEHLPKASGRKMVLYWGARTLKDLYMIEETRALAEKYPNFTFIPVLSRPLLTDEWKGETSRVQQLVMRDMPDLSGWQVYACGSPRMVDDAQRLLISERGVPEHEFFADAFTSMADMAETTA